MWYVIEDFLMTVGVFAVMFGISFLLMIPFGKKRWSWYLYLTIYVSLVLVLHTIISLEVLLAGKALAPWSALIIAVGLLWNGVDFKNGK